LYKKMISADQWPPAFSPSDDLEAEMHSWYRASRYNHGGIAPEDVACELLELGLSAPASDAGDV
jgi:hypothetical protein